MDTHLLMHILCSISPLSSKLQQRFSEYLVEEQFPKKLLAEERAIMLRTRTVEERYLQLLALHPDIMKKASQKQIASYLACSQETLSRLRAKLPMLTQVKKTSQFSHPFIPQIP